LDTKSYKVIGVSGNHDQHAMQIVTGKADFAGDRLPGAKLYGALLLSTIAHGVIKSIDVTQALHDPGVRAVITSSECPLWSNNIWQWGQEVAGVVADNPFTATAAAQSIKVKYDVLPFCFDPDEAMKKGAPLSGVVPGTNSRVITELTRGDMNAGLANADVIVEAIQPWSATFQHHTLETHQAIAWWVGEDVYFWTPSQHIHSAKYSVASALRMPMLRVHAFTHFTGGAHGDKNLSNAAIIAAVMSKAVGGCAVYFLESRRDNAIVNTRQFAMRSNIKLGAKNDGTLTGIDARFWGDGGRNPVTPMGNAHFGLRTTYSCPDAFFQVTMVNTNTPQRGFWRCVNDPPGAFNYDMAIDKLADKLGMNPYDLRMKNLRAFDAPDQDPPFLVWGGNGVSLCLERAYLESDYAFKWHKPGIKKTTGGKLHGIAITGHLDSHGSVSNTPRGAMVLIIPDGKCLINVGGARGSDGSLTACTHIVAETLGVNYSDVSCGEWGNTDVSLDGGMQAGSTFTASAGSAFLNAATDARNKLFTAALQKEPFLSVKAAIDDLDSSDSYVYLKNDRTKKLTYRQVMVGTSPIAGIGNSWTSILRSRSVGGVPIGSVCNSNGSAAACAEVTVDPETGEVEILGLWNVVDSGRTIFRQGVLKQMGSGCELMISQALFYGDIYDRASGALLSTNYNEALFPTMLDINTGHLHMQDIESDDAAGPYGAHGIGEPCVTNYSAIICAIFNAIGKWVDTGKGACTPDKVLKALGKT
jgi:CO/xanthine dehydrogenase Mo-binding subunit